MMMMMMIMIQRYNKSWDHQPDVRPIRNKFSYQSPSTYITWAIWLHRKIQPVIQLQSMNMIYILLV